MNYKRWILVKKNLCNEDIIQSLNGRKIYISKKHAGANGLLLGSNAYKYEVKEIHITIED